MSNRKEELLSMLKNTLALSKSTLFRNSLKVNTPSISKNNSSCDTDKLHNPVINKPYSLDDKKNLHVNIYRDHLNENNINDEDEYLYGYSDNNQSSTNYKNNLDLGRFQLKTSDNNADNANNPNVHDSIDDDRSNFHNDEYHYSSEINNNPQISIFNTLKGDYNKTNKDKINNKIEIDTYNNYVISNDKGSGKDSSISDFSSMMNNILKTISVDENLSKLVMDQFKKSEDYKKNQISKSQEIIVKNKLTHVEKPLFDAYNLKTAKNVFKKELNAKISPKYTAAEKNYSEDKMNSKNNDCFNSLESEYPEYAHESFNFEKISVESQISEKRGTRCNILDNYLDQKLNYSGDIFNKTNNGANFINKYKHNSYKTLNNEADSSWNKRTEDFLKLLQGSDEKLEKKYSSEQKEINKIYNDDHHNKPNIIKENFNYGKNSINKILHDNNFINKSKENEHDSMRNLNEKNFETFINKSEKNKELLMEEIFKLLRNNIKSENVLKEDTERNRVLLNERSNDLNNETNESQFFDNFHQNIHNDVNKLNTRSYLNYAPTIRDSNDTVIKKDILENKDKNKFLNMNSNMCSTNLDMKNKFLNNHNETNRGNKITKPSLYGNNANISHDSFSIKIAKFDNTIFDMSKHNHNILEDKKFNNEKNNPTFLQSVVNDSRKIIMTKGHEIKSELTKDQINDDKLDKNIIIETINSFKKELINIENNKIALLKEDCNNKNGLMIQQNSELQRNIIKQISVLTQIVNEMTRQSVIDKLETKQLELNEDSSLKKNLDFKSDLALMNKTKINQLSYKEVDEYRKSTTKTSSIEEKTKAIKNSELPKSYKLSEQKTFTSKNHSLNKSKCRRQSRSSSSASSTSSASSSSRSRNRSRKHKRSDLDNFDKDKDEKYRSSNKTRKLSINMDHDNKYRFSNNRKSKEQSFEIKKNKDLVNHENIHQFKNKDDCVVILHKKDEKKSVLSSKIIQDKNEKKVTEEKEKIAFEIAIKIFMKGTEFFDGGNLWCKICNFISPNIQELCLHLHSASHQMKMDKEQISNETKKISKSPFAVPARGDEFFKPVQGYCCSLCDEFFKNITLSKEHFNSSNHNNKFKNYMKENPMYEMQYLKGKMEALMNAKKMKNENQAVNAEEGKNLNSNTFNLEFKNITTKPTEIEKDKTENEFDNFPENIKITFENFPSSLNKNSEDRDVGLYQEKKKLFSLNNSSEQLKSVQISKSPVRKSDEISNQYRSDDNYKYRTEDYNSNPKGKNVSPRENRFAMAPFKINFKNRLVNKKT